MTFGFHCRIITQKLPNENPIVTKKKIIYNKKRIDATLQKQRKRDTNTFMFVSPFLAAPVRLELTTLGLTVRCSTG